MEERLMGPKEFVDANMFLVGRGLLKLPDSTYYLQDTYVIGIDPATGSNQKAAFCVYNKTRDTVVALHATPDRNDFQLELEKVLKYYNILEENKFV